MASRYDFMSDSDVRDIDNENYYDPLSVTYNDVQFTKAPPAYRVKDADITKPWLLMNAQYGRQDMDDVLLTLNGIPYIGSLKPGDTIYFIDNNDLENFSTQKLGESEDY